MVCSYYNYCMEKAHMLMNCVLSWKTCEILISSELRSRTMLKEQGNDRTLMTATNTMYITIHMVTQIYSRYV